MPWQIELSKEDLEFAKHMFSGSVVKIKSGTSKFDDVSAQCVLGFYAALEAAVEVESKEPPPEPAPKKKRAKKGTRYVPNFCSEHPMYGAERVTSRDCDGCWEAYRRLHPLDYPLKRREFERKLKA